MNPLTTFSAVSFPEGPWSECATGRARGRGGMSHLALLTSQILLLGHATLL